MVDVKKRDQSFDFIKGFLIICVVLGHVIQYYTNDNGWSTNPVFLFIYTFHMPLFIFISGYFSESAKTKKLLDVLTGKFKRLVVPLMIYSSCILVLYLSSSVIVRGSIQNSIYICYKTYWYLINVFTLTCLYRCLCERSRIVHIVCWGLYILAIVFYDSMPVFLLKDCQILRMMPIFFLGVLFRRFKEPIYFFVKKDVFFVVFCLVSVISGIRTFWGFNLITYPASIRIIDGCVCSILVFIILNYVYFFLEKMRVRSFFIKMGQDSLVIYLFHVILFKMLFFFKVEIDFSLFNVVLMSSFALLLSICWKYLCEKIFNSRYLYIMGI